MSAEAVTALSGAVASFLSGLLGIGGGIVITPLLLYLPAAASAPALPVKIVTGLTVVQAISGGLFGAYRHRRYGHVSMRLVRIMGPTGAAASLAGALASGATPDRVLLGVFAAFAAVAAVAFLLPTHPQDTGVDELQVNVRLAVGISVVVGFFGGMVGIGAIVFILAALIHMLRIPTRIAIGTSLALGFFAAVAALVGKAATAQVDPPLAAIVFLAALVASPIGAAVSRRTQPRVLMVLLAGVVGLAAARIAWQAISGA